MQPLISVTAVCRGPGQEVCMSGVFLNPLCFVPAAPVTAAALGATPPPHLGVLAGITQPRWATTTFTSTAVGGLGSALRIDPQISWLGWPKFTEQSWKRRRPASRLPRYMLISMRNPLWFMPLCYSAGQVALHNAVFYCPWHIDFSGTRS